MEQLNPDLLIQKKSFNINKEIDLSKISTIELEKKIEKLNCFCLSFDPYKKIKKKDQNILKEFGILDFDNPFTITNQLVFKLENMIEELHRRQKL